MAIGMMNAEWLLCVSLAFMVFRLLYFRVRERSDVCLLVCV